MTRSKIRLHDPPFSPNPTHNSETHRYAELFTLARDLKNMFGRWTRRREHMQKRRTETGCRESGRAATLLLVIWQLR
jgi:hypothetical protein